MTALNDKNQTEQTQEDSKRISQWAILFSSIVFTLIGVDVVGDYQDGITLSHLLIELLILLVAFAGIVYFGWLYFRSSQSKIQSLKHDLAVANAQAQQWRDANRELVSGLAAQIQKQFDVWQLTRAEAEVGLLMLKGLSHHEIAQIRGASERTIRDQAGAIYRKAGVAGRSELSAFFLEDLLLPKD